MEIFVVIVFIIALPFIIYSYVSHKIRYNAEGNTLFLGKIDRSRADFLQNTLGLDQKELRLIHFDGHFFHLGSKYPYSNFLSVGRVSSQDVEVVNPNIPHFKTWEHTRVDGGPDRRYSSNPVTRHSKKFNLVFHGTEDISYTIYDERFDYKVNDILEKVNIFLGITREIDMEAIFNEYKVLMTRQRSLQSMLEDKVKEKSKLIEVLSISQRLSAQELPKDVTELQSKRTSLESEILDLQRDLSLVKQELDKLIQNVKSSMGVFKDKQKIREYYSNQKTAG